MSITVTVDEAKKTLVELLARVASGEEEVVIASEGQPLARLVAVPARPKQRLPGSAAGQFTIPPEFYEPLSDEELKEWGL